MAHRRLKPSYENLVDRLNRFPQGAPPSETLFKILELLFDQEEAELVSALPIRPFTVAKASRIWKKGLAETQKILETLASRAVLVDVMQNEEQHYVLPPPMAGFFEFSLMRVGGAIDQAALSELYYQYLNVEEDFVKQLMAVGDTQLGRVFINESVLTNEYALHVLDYEKATEVINTASHISVGTCYCRHKMQHVGRDCAAPKDICMTFNTTAASLSRRGYARTIEVAECMDLLHEAYENELVQFGENVREGVNFICNCCGCCCEAMIAARRFGFAHPVHTTNFIPVIDSDGCVGCGECVRVCPVEAMTLVSANDAKKNKKKKSRLDDDLCLGCGLCVRACKKDNIHMESRPKKVLTPLNTTHRTVVMAIERGLLQNLIFDNRVLWSHRALAAVLGVILNLPPIKQAMASRQMKSRYLETLCRKS